MRNQIVCCSRQDSAKQRDRSQAKAVSRMREATERKKEGMTAKVRTCQERRSWQEMRREQRKAGTQHSTHGSHATVMRLTIASVHPTSQLRLSWEVSSKQDSFLESFRRQGAIRILQPLMRKVPLGCLPARQESSLYPQRDATAKGRHLLWYVK